jgi:hypothetical protein
VALPSNSTLRRLYLEQQNVDADRDSLSVLLSALRQNKGPRTLIVQGCSMNESLCTAMRNGLEMNETLESLELRYVPLCDDNADLWCRALSFLRINKALKSMEIKLYHQDVTGSCVSAFLIDIATMLQENASLERLSISLGWCKIKAEDYLAFVTSLQSNTTLKTLTINQNGSRVEAEDYLAFITALQGNTTLMTLSIKQNGRLRLTDDEGQQMATLLKKNYAMESFPDINLENEAGDAGAILRLNGAGRRYPIEDGSSVSKGVEVLSRVNNDIDCVFLHLSENPRLCDRSAVEKVSDAVESNGSSTNPTAGSDCDGGNRERASVHEGKVSHRRLAKFR